MTRDASRRLFRAEPLPTRMHPGPPRRTSPGTDWRTVRSFVVGLSAGDDAQSLATRRLTTAIADVPPTAMTAAGVANLYADCVLARRRPWFRHDLDDPRTESAIHAAVLALLRWFLAVHGGRALALAVDRVRTEDVLRLPPGVVPAWSHPVYLAARSLLARAPAAEYEAAREAFRAIAAGEDWRAAAVFAFVLADDRPEPHALQALSVLHAAVAAGTVPAREPALAALIADAPPGAVAQWRNHRRGTFSFAPSVLDPARLAATVAAVAIRAGAPALPGLAWLLHQARDDDRTTIARAMLATWEEGALDPLLPFLHRRWARAALARAETCDPAWTVGRYLVAVAAGRGGPMLRARLLDRIDAHGSARIRAWAQTLGPPALACLDRLTGPDEVALAHRDAWPAALRSPPWRDPNWRSVTRHVVTLAPLPTPLPSDVPAVSSIIATFRERRAVVLPSLASLRGLIATEEASIGPEGDAVHRPARLPPSDASEETLLAWLVARLTEIDGAGSSPWFSPLYGGLYCGLERQPAALALRLWRHGGPRLALHRSVPSPARAMLRRFGEQVLPEVVRLVADDPYVGFAEFADLAIGELAPVAARAVVRTKAARAGALGWLRRHQSVALVHLVPPALGPAGPERDEAGLAIRRLHRDRGGAEALAGVVARYAATTAGVDEAMAEVLAYDELHLTPDPIPRLPDWFVPSTLSRPVLRAGGALGDDAVIAIGEILSFSRPDSVHAGVELVKEACTPASLGRFVSDLLAAWMAAGMPGRQGWALWAMGWLGDDASVPALVAALRRLGEARALPQVAMAIAALAEIGSDAAVTQLGAVARSSGAKSMRQKAGRHLLALAQARGLTRDELRDRTAPDLGLDRRGGLDLDFGPRRFRITFDAALHPLVREDTGPLMSDLPRPRRSDDATLAAAATARWRTLKRETRTAAGPTLLRLETMLATARRIAPDVFLTSFARHPWVQNPSRHLLWGVFDDAAPDSVPRITFRLAGDTAFVDADDEPVAALVPGATGVVGLVHPLQLAPDMLDTWRRAFLRQGVAQPFPQVDRAVYRLSAAERARASLHRFQGLVVEAGWLRGMGTRGWPFERPVGNGLMWAIEREVVLRDGLSGMVSLEFAEGIRVGTPDPGEPPRTLGTLDLRVPAEDREWSPAAFDRLDAVTASEILRDLDALARHGAHPAAAAAPTGGVTRLQ